MHDIETIRDWFSRWGRCVAGVDVDGARPLFSAEVVGFGTYKDMVHGIDALADEQWCAIWPTIREFRFDLASLRVLSAADESLTVAMILWDSVGIGEDGRHYPRPGRATVVLRRAGDGWLGEHTHFSLFPAERKLSFG